MTSAIELGVNRSTAADIRRHLLACDATFVPPLSERVVIEDYAQKLFAAATRCEAWAGGVLVGLVAVYCNDTGKRAAFISSVSVVEELQRQGIAARLIDVCIGHLRALDFDSLDLEVAAGNAGALSLYEAKGFLAVGGDNRTIRMRLKLKTARGSVI